MEQILTIEYRPFNSDRWSHKINGLGLHYEVAIACKTGYIVHYNGPFICGSWPDLRIARLKLHKMLPIGEYYLCDDGYRCKYSPGITKRDIPATELNLKTSIMAKHESINRRFKQWGILQ